MNKILKKGQVDGAICAIAALFCLLTPAKAIVVAYLPKVGVPELRFRVVTTNDFNYSQFFKLESATAGSNATTSVNSATNLKTTSAASASNEDVASASMFSTGTTQLRELNQPGIGEDNMAGGENEPMHRENFNFPSSTASDLLTVTPQMIAQYLKPDPNATNSLDRPGAVVFVPADLSFAPPAPKGRSESQANYHSP